MPTTQEAKFVADIYSSLLKNSKTRLLRGLKLRQEMHDAIERGERPTGYRPDFIRAGTVKLIKMLDELAGEFNRAHPEDQCSGSDLLDVLASTNGLLKRKLSE
jgi:hypothetical protein